MRKLLNNIKVLKKNCKVSLNGYFNKRKFNNDEKSHLYDSVFVSNRNFTLKSVKDFRFLF